MTTKETGRDLGEGATRTMLLQSIRNDYPGLTGGAQCARMHEAMRRADPQQKTAKNGNAFAIARMSVPMDDEGRVSCSMIAFDEHAVTRLLQLRAGASVAAAGVLKLGVYTGKDGVTRPNLDLVADEIASTTPRPKRPRPAAPAPARQQQVSDPFRDDAPWMEA